MDLRKRFGTDPKIERDGVDVHLGGDAYITIARAGGSNVAYQTAMQRALKPVRRAMQADALSNDDAEAIMRNVFADTVVIGWRGIELDGAPLEFSKENAKRLFAELPEVFRIVQEEAQRLSNFRQAEIDESGKV